MSDRKKIKQQQILIDVAKRGEEWKKKTKWIVQMNIHEIMWYHLIWDGTNSKVADDKIYRSNATFSSQIGRVFFSPSLHFAFVMFIFLFFILRCWRKKKTKAMPTLTMRQWTEKHRIKYKMKKWTNKKTCRQQCETESVCNWMPLES